MSIVKLFVDIEKIYAYYDILKGGQIDYFTLQTQCKESIMISDEQCQFFLIN